MDPNDRIEDWNVDIELFKQGLRAQRLTMHVPPLSEPPIYQTDPNITLTSYVLSGKTDSALGYIYGSVKYNNEVPELDFGTWKKK